MEEFKKEVHKLPTKDIVLILEDQVDLYSEEELEILRAELDSRPANAYELEEEELRRKEETERIRTLLEQERKAFEEKIERLKAKGYEGYFEYMTLSLVDNDGGGLTANQVSQTLNNYALDGWRLVSAYANELGHNSTSGGFGGFTTGTNSTIDQHILILERYIRI